MQGTSGTYALNGVELSLFPTTGKWGARDEIGRDGNNRPIYPSLRTFEMAWDVMAISDLKQIIDASLVCSSGSVVTDLPKWGDTDYSFYSYTGTIINEPQVGEYFTGYVMGISLLISNIRTN